MTAAFDAAVAIVLENEGGYTDDPGDPGNWTGGVVGSGQLKGTNFGISAAAYPRLDIANLTQAQAEAIYEADYWAPIQGDALPSGLSLIVFDGAVNSGVEQSSVWLQQAVNVTTDGDIGPETLAAVAGWNSGANPQPPWALCASVLAWRLVALGQVPDFSDFGQGWMRRVARLAFQASQLL
ncbi:MAG: glycoside hydrolase family 108 protein [Acetobacteraceae bacterium]